MVGLLWIEKSDRWAVLDALAAGRTGPSTTTPQEAAPRREPDAPDQRHPSTKKRAQMFWRECACGVFRGARPESQNWLRQI